MKQLADGVWQLSGFPPNSINVFVIEDVLIDASTRYATRRILRQVDDRKLSAHALTHAHPDHQGASHNVCERLGIPFWVGEGDADAAETPDLIGERQPDHPIAQLFFKTCTGPGHPVDRKLVEGDEVGGFKVLQVPGHSAGHVAFWRESDRVLIAGDVLNTQNPLLTFPRGPRQPFDFFTPDPEENRRSIRRLGDLEPAAVAVGHGPVWRDTKRFVEFCRSV